MATASQPRKISLLWGHYSCCLVLIVHCLVQETAAFETSGSTHEQQRIPYYGNYYEYSAELDSTTYSTLSDIWLCLACALGWSVWLVSTRAQSQEESPASDFDAQNTKKVMGHVLQVSLGEDADGTGIPVYHALVDYVVYCENTNNNSCLGNDMLEDPEVPIQVRKCFNTQKILQEGFANVEVLVLADDPTTSILYDDYLQAKKEQPQPHSFAWIVGMYILALGLVGTSLVGGLHALNRLEPSQKFYGWISLGVGVVLLYPLAVLLHQFCLWFFSDWSGRPGVIIHDTRAALSKQCGALNPLKRLFSEDEQMQQLDKPSLELVSPKIQKAGTSPTFPNAGCKYGNFNVHMQEPSSSVSSMSSARSSLNSRRTLKTENSLGIPHLDSSIILEQYEQAVNLEMRTEKQMKSKEQQKGQESNS